MSNTVTPPSPARPMSGSERTRQQLQELDALLQQMLALPIADAPGVASKPEPPATLPFTPLPTHPRVAAADPLTATLDVASTPRSESAAPPVLKRLVPLRVSPPAGHRSAATSGLKAPQPLVLHSPETAGDPRRTDPLPGTPLALVPRPTPAPILTPTAQPQKVEAARADRETIEELSEEAILPLRSLSPAVIPITPAKSAVQEHPKDAPESFDIASFDLRGPVDFDLASEYEGAGMAYGDSSAPTVGLAELHRGPLEPQGLNSSPLNPSSTSRHPFIAWVKSLLGWLGIVLLLAAAALTVGGWLGWTW